MGELTASLSAQEFARWVALSAMDKEQMDRERSAAPDATGKADTLQMFQLEQGKDSTR